MRFLNVELSRPTRQAYSYSMWLALLGLVIGLGIQFLTNGSYAAVLGLSLASYAGCLIAFSGANPTAAGTQGVIVALITTLTVFSVSTTLITLLWAAMLGA